MREGCSSGVDGERECVCSVAMGGGCSSRAFGKREGRMRPQMEVIAIGASTPRCASRIPTSFDQRVSTRCGQSNIIIPV